MTFLDKSSTHFPSLLSLWPFLYLVQSLVVQKSTSRFQHTLEPRVYLKQLSTYQARVRPVYTLPSPDHTSGITLGMLLLDFSIF